jgi:hypothetical protein
MIIEGNSVAECWLKILKELVDNKKCELSPIIVKINITDESPPYKTELENELNSFLEKVNQPPIETTAGTIFPISLSSGKTSIFERYNRIWKGVKHAPKNNRGTYFRRLMAYGDEYVTDKYATPVNQLKHIIETYNGITNGRGKINRRSAFIATTFDPLLDHKSTPYLGFPCLQQVCFIPSSRSKKLMKMNAIYAMQDLDTRAYGNYLGLLRLGKFMANEMGLEFIQLNCMLSVLKLRHMNKSTAKKLLEKYSNGS